MSELCHDPWHDRSSVSFGFYNACPSCRATIATEPKRDAPALYKCPYCDLSGKREDMITHICKRKPAEPAKWKCPRCGGSNPYDPCEPLMRELSRTSKPAADERPARELWICLGGDGVYVFDNQEGATEHKEYGERVSGSAIELIHVREVK